MHGLFSCSILPFPDHHRQTLPHIPLFPSTLMALSYLGIVLPGHSPAWALSCLPIEPLYPASPPGPQTPPRLSPSLTHPLHDSTFSDTPVGFPPTQAQCDPPKHTLQNPPRFPPPMAAPTPLGCTHPHPAASHRKHPGSSLHEPKCGCHQNSSIAQMLPNAPKRSQTHTLPSDGQGHPSLARTTNKPSAQVFHSPPPW